MIKINKMSTIFTCVLLVSLFFSAVFSCSAASAKDFTVYRNGALVSNYAGLTEGSDVWHAGFVNSTLSTDFNYVVHQLSIEDGLTICTLSNFLGNDVHDRLGYYRPNTFLESEDLADVRITVMMLSLYDMEYNRLYQVVAKAGTGSTIEPEDVKSFRCDGFVEYIYELNNIRIYGNDSNWNVSTNSIACKTAHSLLSITPKKQAQNYLHTLLGDIDVSQSVTAEDSRKVLRFSANLDIPDEFQCWASDVDGNGYITAADARLVLKYSAALISSFPAEP